MLRSLAKGARPCWCVRPVSRTQPIFTSWSTASPATAPSSAAPSRKFAKTSATSPSPNPKAAFSSAAAPCTSTALTSAEVRSIVVRPEAKSHGVGGEFSHSLLGEAEDHGVGCVCLFTRIPDYFFRYGFREVADRTALPDKIFKDCQNCPRLYRCDEVAMARGQVPKVSILGPRIEAEQLVRLTV